MTDKVKTLLEIKLLGFDSLTREELELHALALHNEVVKLNEGDDDALPSFSECLKVGNLHVYNSKKPFKLNKRKRPIIFKTKFRGRLRNAEMVGIFSELARQSEIRAGGGRNTRKAKAIKEIKKMWKVSVANGEVKHGGKARWIENVLLSSEYAHLEIVGEHLDNDLNYK